MRCANNRKASLSISTNAIVILIVAVIMLGLIIGLVTEGFGLVEDRLFEQIEQSEPDPPTPSADNPITLSSTAKRVIKGEADGLIVNMLNPISGETLTLSPKVECLIDIDGDGDYTDDAKAALTQQPNFEQELSYNEYEEFIVTFTVAESVDEGAYNCRIVDYPTGSEPALNDHGAFRITVSN